MECKKCGSCCRDWKVKYTMYKTNDNGLNEILWEIPVTGQCDHLVGNLCSIYATRPIICRITRCWVEGNDDVPKINSGIRDIIIEEETI